MGASRPTGGVALELRPATGADLELLWRIHRTALGADIEEVLGSDEAEQRAFFDEHFESCKHELVVVEGEAPGCWPVPLPSPTRAGCR